METTQKTRKKLKAKSPIISLAEDIARKSNEPMSIDQIRAKWQVEFPFQIKKVVKTPGTALEVGVFVMVTGFYTKECKTYSVDLGDEFNAHGQLEQWVLV